jgi:hypothetical protein
MNLEVQEVMLEDKQVRSRHPFDGWDLSVEVEWHCAHLDVVEGERATVGANKASILCANMLSICIR